MKVTAIANSNIAIIKYWGMRDERAVLPTNSSISFTMDDRLQTTTSVEFDESLKKDEMLLDGQPASEKECTRVTEFLEIVRASAKNAGFARIVSNNSFPKAAGLASSASGFAALAAAASKAAGLELSEEQLSALARRGSGSASRSIFGGAVEWQAGKKKDGSDCHGEQLSPPERWRELRNVIAITSSREKRISSMEAMKRTVKTSKLFHARLKGVEERLALVRKAIAENDFEGMAPATMQESDSMHAVMLDSWPPVVYLNEISLHIMRKVVELNELHGRPVAAYTFDAGPNAHVFTTSKHEDDVKKALGEVWGIEKIMTCWIGNGIRYSRKHLF